MPSWQFHRQRMRLQGDDATRLLQLMDSGVPEIHMQYRQKTHKPEKAVDIAMLVTMMAEDPDPEMFKDALADALEHIQHDQLYNKIFYGRPRPRLADD